MIHHKDGPNKGRINQQMLTVTGQWSLGDRHPDHKNIYFIQNKKGKQNWGTYESLLKAIAKRKRTNKARDPESMAKATAKWRLNNPTKHREVNARSRAKRRANGKEAAYKRRYARLNPQTISESNRRAREKRIANGKSHAYWNKPSVRIITALRQRLHSTVKNNKKPNSLELLGNTREGIKQHLENQFADGMSWKNYGYDGWHIDHIIPCAAFDLTKPEQQRICFNYQNLRPLWAQDNRIKSAKIPWSIIQTIILNKYKTITPYSEANHSPL